MTIIWVVPDLPYPLNTGANVAIYNRMREMSRRGHTQTLMAFIPPGNSGGSVPGSLTEICSKVFTYSKLSRWGAMRRYVLPSSPPFRVITRPARQLQLDLARIIEQRSPEVVQIENSILAHALPNSRMPGRTSFFINFHSLLHQEYERISAHAPLFSPSKVVFHIEASKIKEFELGILQKDDFDGYFFVSDVEMRCMGGLFPHLKDKLAHVPIGLDLDSWAGLQPIVKCELHRGVPGKNILFFGGFENPANLDAVRWFAQAVFPSVRRECPATTFVMMGRNALRYVADLRSTNIEILSDVEDVRPHLACADLCVMPLRGGGGVRVKLLEAVAAHKVVVTTSLGLEGVSFSPGRHVLVADTAEDFTRHCVDVLSHPERFAQMSQDAFALLGKKNSWTAVGDQLESLYLDAVRRKQS